MRCVNADVERHQYAAPFYLVTINVSAPHLKSVLVASSRCGHWLTPPSGSRMVRSHLKHTWPTCAAYSTWHDRSFGS